MKGAIRWAIKNTPAMNMLMVAILAVGLFSLVTMRREVFPQFDLEIVVVNVAYPGASPEEIEEGICQKVEEAVRGVDGIKKMTSVAKEGSGTVVLELRGDVQDVQKIVSEVRSEVDRIPSFPDLAEDIEVQQITMRWPAIKLGVLAPENKGGVDELQLRAMAERVRDDLLRLPEVSQVKLLGARDFQIDIEIPEETLRKYGLTLQKLAEIVRRENLELPGGTMRGEGQNVLLRGKNKQLSGPEIARIPVVTDQTGVALTLADLGTVKDEFTDAAMVSEVNGQPALVLGVERTSNEDLLAMTDAVRRYVADYKLPGGYSMVTWQDMSVDVEDRLNMLIKNGLMGLILVFLVLAIFLELKLAFWVALGIPVSLLGAGSLLLFGGQTLNMLSMFAFLMALGIVVDDAIVVGENIYSHRQMGKRLIEAAIDGTVEVAPSVVASVCTTIVAFGPMLFVSGVMGKFIAVMPIAVIAMLAISLFESVFILPCHLAHRDSLLFRFIGIFLFVFHFFMSIFRRLNRFTADYLERFIEKVYLPALRWSLECRWVVLAGAASLLLVAVGFVRAGIVPFIVFPKLDSNVIRAKVAFPDGTPLAVTQAATDQIEQSLWDLNRDMSPPEMELVELSHRSIGSQAISDNPAKAEEAFGSHVGNVEVQLADTTRRQITSQEIISEWRRRTGAIPGAESLTFGAPNFGPGGKPIEFKLLAPTVFFQDLEKAVEICKSRLQEFKGVYDVEDDSRPGKWEYQIRVRDDAKSMGVSTADLAETVRATYYGEEVMRLQRGRHEVKLMVRYPESDRKSLKEFEQLRIRAGDGQERPLTELAEVDVARGYSEINRVDQMRSITISADVEEGVGNARQIVQQLQAGFMPELLAEFPAVQVRWEGQQEQTKESIGSLLTGTMIALMVMFFLLTLVFRSYLQPLLIVLIIPFGIIGAIFGHAIMGLPITLFSFFGLVALTGVVVNDSIVLIDFINRRVRDGVPIDDALIDAGRRRFRPVLLTTLTTVAGLLPILLETSFQAQVLIPMANSLSFGLLLATGLILILVPTTYRIYHNFFSGPDGGQVDELPKDSKGSFTYESDQEISQAVVTSPEHVSLRRTD
ncbi:MAG: efflux RND transporter permease subunit [Planctomycetota bacterium]|nr:efflux RND transporter permease subunit [Planctomycetota bacterium]